MFEPIKGTKILVFGTCYSGGLVGGERDLHPDQDQKLVVMMASAENEPAYTPKPTLEGDGASLHTWYGAALIAGLTKENAADKFARADADKDGQVTAGELHVYAHAKVVDVSRQWGAKPGISDLPQNPRFAGPRFAGAGDFVVLDYVKKADQLKVHSATFIVPGLGGSQKSGDRCGGCDVDGCRKP